MILEAETVDPKSPDFTQQVIEVLDEQSEQ